MAYTSPPVIWHHELVIGDTYSPAVIRLTDADGDPYDLTGATGVAELRTEPGGMLLLTPTVALVDADDGQFSWSSTAAATAGLVPAKARYSVRLTFADGSKRTILEGTVLIRRSVVTP